MAAHRSIDLKDNQIEKTTNTTTRQDPIPPQITVVVKTVLLSNESEVTDIERGVLTKEANAPHSPASVRRFLSRRLITIHLCNRC